MRHGLIIMISAMVTWLLFHITTGQCAGASQPATGPEYAHYEATIRLHSSVYPMRVFHGLVSLGQQSQCRCVLYWKEPVEGFYDMSSELAFVDIMLDGNGIHGILGATLEGDGRFSINCATKVPDIDLRSDNGTMLIASVIAQAACRAKLPDGCNVASLVPDEVLSKVRQVGTHAWVTSAPSDLSKDGRELNPHELLLPFGRRGQLDVEKDGRVHMHIASLTGTPVLDLEMNPTTIALTTLDDIFDRKTLGDPPHVSRVYKEFWSLWRSLWMLRGASPEEKRGKAVIIQKAGTKWLQDGVPDRVAPALYALVARSSAIAGDAKTSLDALRGMFASRATNVPSAIMILSELRSLLDQDDKAVIAIEQMARDQLRLAIEQGIDPIEMTELLGSLISTKGYAVARLIISELRQTDFIDPKTLDDYERQIASWQIASPGVDKEPDYVTLFRERRQKARQGAISPEEIKTVIEASLAKTALADELRDSFAEDTIEKLATLVGPGPYPGSPKRLKDAISRSVSSHQPGTNSADWLAIMIALAFYDESTPELQLALRDQLGECAAKMVDFLWNEVGAALDGKKVPKDDVKVHAVASVHALVQPYVDDPLWPAFKYPLSDNELMRIESRIELQIRREVRDLLPALTKADATALHGMLKEMMSSIAGSILARTLSVRLPAIVGVGFERRERGALQITWRVEVPDKKQKAVGLLDKCMYFYLGHRLTPATVSSATNRTSVTSSTTETEKR